MLYCSLPLSLSIPRLFRADHPAIAKIIFDGKDLERKGRIRRQLCRQGTVVVPLPAGLLVPNRDVFGDNEE